MEEHRIRSERLWNTKKVKLRTRRPNSGALRLDVNVECYKILCEPNMRRRRQIAVGEGKVVGIFTAVFD